MFHINQVKGLCNDTMLQVNELEKKCDLCFCDIKNKFSVF